MSCGSRPRSHFEPGVGRVGAALGREIARRLVGVVGDRLHHLVGELDRGLGGEGGAAAVEGVLQAHHAQPDGTVAHVRAARRLGGVEVDVDHVVEGPHGDAHRLAQALVVDLAVVGEVLVEHDRAEVADRRLVLARCSA